jgi:hypothetical protein
MRRSVFVTLSLVLLVVGLVVMFGSVRWGAAAANAYLASQGGGMDGAQFMIVFQESINMYRWMGGVLSLIGGFGLVRAIEPR